MSIKAAPLPATETPSMTYRLGRILPYFLIGLLVLLFLFTATDGPDFFRYLEWAQAFQKGDSQVFLPVGRTLSPLGVPLTQWSHGPGLIFSLCSPICQRLMSLGRQAIWTSWALTVLFWWAMFMLLRRAADGDLQWTMYGILVGILGTHLGFYSRSYGSETLSQVFLAVMASWVLSRKEWRILDTLVVGCLTGLLLINRGQLVIYALPLLATMAYSLWRTRATRSRMGTSLLLVVALLPMLAGFLQLAAVNRWMTGDFLRSVYAFGNATFRSLDFRRPEVVAVLIHPWHGLLSYHPLYMLGFVALVALVFQSRSREVRLFYTSYVLAILANVYLQAGWYVWWLGTKSFGMRGLSAGAVILVPALIRFMRLREMRNKSNAVLAALVLVACAWSAPLFMASLYDETQSNFMTYGDLFRFYVDQAGSLRYSLLLTAVLFAAALLVSLARRKAPDTLPGRFVEQLRARPALTISLALLFPTALYSLTRYGLDRHADQWGSAALLIPYLALVSVALAALLIMTFLTAVPAGRDDALPATPRALSERKRVRISRAEDVLGCILIGVFIAANIVFVRFAARLENEGLDRSYPLHQIQYVSPVYVDEVGASYQEYLNVPGFSAKKAALLDYVKELAASSTARAEAEIIRRLDGLTQVHLAAEAQAGEDLVLKGIDLVGGAGDDGATFYAGNLAGVRTHWQVLRAGRPLNFNLRLQDAGGRVWLAVDYPLQPGREAGTGRLGAGLFTDHRGVSLPPDLPPGQYEFRLAAYDRETGAPVSIGGAADVSLATIDLRTAATPPDPSTLSIPEPRRLPIGDELELLGYGVIPDPLPAEAQAALRVWWRALHRPSQPYELLIELVDRSGQPIARSRQPLSIAPADTWQQGQIVSETYPLALSRGVLSGNYRLRLSLAASGSDAASSSVEAGAVAVQARQRTYRLPPVERALSVRFGQGIMLRGYTVDQLAPDGQQVRLTLYWQSLEPVTEDYKVFVHALDNTGRVVAQSDSYPGSGADPTRTWLAGEIITDEHILALPARGPYRLVAGLYDPVSGQRPPAWDQAQQPVPDSAVPLESITAP